MRGTSAAQRMQSANYSARKPKSAAAITRNNANTVSPSAGPVSRQPSSSPPPASAPSTPVDSPLYYVVGNAVVNPLLTVSASVQGQLRGVTTLASLPDAMRRPGIGPQLHNTHTTSTTTTTTTAQTSTPAAAAPFEGPEEDSDAVVYVESIRDGRATVGDNAPSMQQTRAGSLVTLRQLYGTTADDVIEMAQTNPRTGLLEPPRMQHHTAQELLPELASTAAQLKAMSNARRRIDWDVSIPTAATLPPPAITFTAANGNPVVTLTSIVFAVDTSTLVMQRDYAAEKAMNATATAAASRVSILSEAGGSVTMAATPSATATTEILASANNTAAAATRTNGTKASLLQEEEKVGLDVSREDRIGSSGLFRIRRLVGLRHGLGEMVGLDRVLEYEVVTTSPKLFLMQPCIDASSGDLLMELNTSLQGTAKLVITGVDCCSVDDKTGSVQKSSNVLACYITLRHNTAAATAAAALRSRSLVNSSVGNASQYTCVPSAATRLPRAGPNNRNLTNSNSGNARTDGVLTESNSTSRNNTANDSPGGSDGFSLSLAHFSQESGVAERSVTGNGSLPRDATGGGGAAAGGGANGRHNLDVQSVVARKAAAHTDLGGVNGSSVISGAYSSARRSSSNQSGGASRPHRKSASTRKAGGEASASRYLFTLTNPHDLRYAHYTEAVRLARLQQYARQHDKERQEEVQQRRSAQSPAALKSVGSPSFTNVHNINNSNSNNNNGCLRHQVSLHNAVSNDIWSDEDDKDTSRELSEENRIHALESTATTEIPTDAADKQLVHHQSTMDISELEEDFDQSKPLAMPIVTGMMSQELNNGSGNGGVQRQPSTQRLRSESCNSIASIGGEDGRDSAVVRELRRSRLPSTLFCMNTMQSPVSYLRLTVWQDRLLLLFTEDDKELLSSDQRARFKREARLELTEGSLVGMLSSTFAWSANPSSSIGGRRQSMHGRRSSSVFNPRNINSVAGGGGVSVESAPSNVGFSTLANKSSGMSGPTSGSGSTSGLAGSSEKQFTLIRRLILCLALEEERSSVQLYADVVQLCSHLCHNALLQTMTLTRGTRDGLQQAAAAVLGSSPPAPSANGGNAASAQPPWEGSSTLSASDRDSLQLLSDTLALALTVSLLIGAYGNAVEYAVQRVHALCLLEGDTTAVVNSAQRDLVEAYLFYGDYDTAVTIAEDVVMLTEQLCAVAPDAYELGEAQALCTLACVGAGRRDRLAHYITRLEVKVMPLDDGSSGALAVPLPLLQAQLRLVLSFAKMNVVRATAGTTASDVVPLVREAVRLLRGDGDLQEMEPSFSTVFPSQARPMTTLESSNTNIPLSMCGWVPSGVNGGSTAGSQPTNHVAADGDDSDAAVQKMMAAQKRLRWNLLSFAGALLVESEEAEEGIEVMESTVKELVLGQHRYIERTHRASMAAMLWVGLVLSKAWAQPTSKEDFVPMLKEVTNRVVRIKGPLHPLAAAANMQYVNVAHYSLGNRQAFSVAARSLSVLESAVSPQSHYLLMAHYVFGSMAESQQRWRPALEHLSAAYAIAQANHLSELDLLDFDSRFLGALLSCPPTAIVDVDTTALRGHVERRLSKVQQSAGLHSEALVEPLWNMAEVHYMFKQTASAVECLQKAERLLDRRGVLLAFADLLRPADLLRFEQHETAAAESTSTLQLLQQRDAVVQSSFDSVHQALRLATSLYMIGAVLESQARTTEAQRKYEQCIAIFEALHLDSDTLSAARVMMTLGKLLYTTAQCSDALVWARKAELLLHVHYRKQWPLELAGAEKLVAVVERRLCEDEGTYVVQSDVPAQDRLPRLL
ncbi:hypothetical protein ABB37_05446 [Leptomonas pyrrhocoris]|uniref:Uncharacterized protein n=1 Tax=Leptomonas pyrrhocoris TaxID=157538 RepID=A0A0M9G0C9_LEPPY|nr:hypothetical protein ABB37_05446 [Leptomonas pyrrhocoris]KPA79663.1 hypothetical protein ABB37_05446 [Leptomonas pyrrhocoris]|eukprot:XP_015658102.1 hypothetical protein ABB37_05446 [Leptomonas pyrrhocoris]